MPPNLRRVRSRPFALPRLKLTKTTTLVTASMNARHGACLLRSTAYGIDSSGGIASCSTRRTLACSTAHRLRPVRRPVGHRARPREPRHSPAAAHRPLRLVDGKGHPCPAPGSPPSRPLWHPAARPRPSGPRCRGHRRCHPIRRPEAPDRRVRRPRVPMRLRFARDRRAAAGYTPRAGPAAGRP
jgi:hypothetical protein